MNRKQRRALNKISKNDKAASTIDLMLSIPDHCLTCDKLYDKSDKEAARNWFVEVYNSQKRVDLYCPECQDKRVTDASAVR